MHKAILIIPIIALALGGYLFRDILQRDVSHTTVTAPLALEEDTVKIIAFGDSLTAGYGVDLAESYPSILQTTLNQTSTSGQKFTVINMGVSGETSTGGLERTQFVINQNPDIVLLGLGANDMLRGTPPSITRKNLDTIIAQFIDKKIPVVLLGMQSVASNGVAYSKEFNAIYPDLARTYTLPLVPFFLQGVALDPSLNTADGIHPNRAGYETIVRENILPVLVPLLTN